MALSPRDEIRRGLQQQGHHRRPVAVAPPAGDVQRTPLAVVERAGVGAAGEKRSDHLAGPAVGGPQSDSGLASQALNKIPEILTKNTQLF